MVIYKLWILTHEIELWFLRSSANRQADGCAVPGGRRATFTACWWYCAAVRKGDEWIRILSALKVKSVDKILCSLYTWCLCAYYIWIIIPDVRVHAASITTQSHCLRPILSRIQIFQMSIVSERNFVDKFVALFEVAKFLPVSIAWIEKTSSLILYSCNFQGCHCQQVQGSGAIWPFC